MVLIIKKKRVHHNRMLSNCPDCQKPLHEGQHRYTDGLFKVLYCKKCGFRKEVPLEE